MLKDKGIEVARPVYSAAGGEGGGEEEEEEEGEQRKEGVDDKEKLGTIDRQAKKKKNFEATSEEEGEGEEG